MARLSQRKGDISRVMKRGTQTNLIAYLLRAMLDTDLTDSEKEWYPKVLARMTSSRTLTTNIQENAITDGAKEDADNLFA
jgi:hypothetical protein